MPIFSPSLMFSLEAIAKNSTLNVALKKQIWGKLLCLTFGGSVT